MKYKARNCAECVSRVYRYSLMVVVILAGPLQHFMNDWKCEHICKYKYICISLKPYFIILHSCKSNLNSPFYISPDLNLNLNGLCICIYMLTKYINSIFRKKKK